MEMISYQDLLRSGAMRCTYINPNTGKKVTGHIIAFMGGNAIITSPIANKNVTLPLKDVMLETSNPWGRTQNALNVFVRSEDLPDNVDPDSENTWYIKITRKAMYLGGGIVAVFIKYFGGRTEKPTLDIGVNEQGSLVLVPRIDGKGHFEFSKSGEIISNMEDVIGVLKKAYKRYDIDAMLQNENEIILFGNQRMDVGNNLIPYMYTEINWDIAREYRIESQNNNENVRMDVHPALEEVEF